MKPLPIKWFVLLPYRALCVAIRILTSRLMIFTLMTGLLVASHTVAFVADLAFRTISTTASIASSRGVTFKSNAALRAENQALVYRASAQRAVANRNLERMRQRVKRTTVANVAAAGGEALPFVGIGIIVGATAYEVSEACATMSDIYDLQVAFDPTLAHTTERDAVCGLHVPTREELWTGIVQAPGAAWDASIAAAQETADWAADLERPDFGGMWQASILAVAGWFE